MLNEKLISALYYRVGSNLGFQSVNFLRCGDFFHFSALRDAIELSRPWNETCHYCFWNVYFLQTKWLQQYKLFEVFKKEISLSSCFVMTNSTEPACFCIEIKLFFIYYESIYYNILNTCLLKKWFYLLFKLS